MKKTIRDMRPVYVVGIGLHKFGGDLPTLGGEDFG